MWQGMPNIDQCIQWNQINVIFGISSKWIVSLYIFTKFILKKKNTRESEGKAMIITKNNVASF